MPDTIAIICTLDEIVPHSLGDPHNRHFTFNISVSLTNDSAGSPPVPDVFQPWKWKNVGLRILPSKGASGTKPDGTSFLDTTDTALPHGTTPPVVTAVSTALSSRFTNANPPGGQLYFRWADQPGIVGPPNPPDENWSRVLAHASTWPAPVPTALNLSFHVIIPLTALTPDITRLFIAPEFTAAGVTYAMNGVPTPGPVLNPSGIVLCNWAYTLTGGPAPQPGDPVYAAFQPEFPLQALPSPATVQNPGPFFDFNTYWIAVKDPANPSPEAVASEDWRSSLESNAADAFDLVQRILTVLRANPSLLNDPSAFQTVFNGIVSALRDNADFGLRCAPDGQNAVRFVLNRPNVRNAATAAGISDDALSAGIDAVVVALQGAPIPKPDWATYWHNLLLATAGANTSQPLSSPTALLNACDTLQSAVAYPSTLATLIFTQWNDVLTASSTASTFFPNPALTAAASTFWSNIASTVETELQTLATSRTLRTRLLKANLGGDDSGVAVWKSLTNTKGISGYTQEVAAVMSNLEALIPAWFRARFGMPSTDPSREKLFLNRNPPVLNWKIDLSSLLATDAAQFQARFFHDSTSEATRIPHPVLVEVGATEDPEDTTPGALNDQSRKIAGVGMLILEHPQNGNQTFWTCANVSNLYTSDSDADLVAANVIAPLRQRKRNNLKQPVLAYNSASLISAADTNPANTALSTNSATPNIPGLFQYRASVASVAGTASIDGNNILTIPVPTPPDGTKIDDWKRIPSLKFGRTYDFLPFLVGNNGALPFLLADTGIPFQPATPNAFALALKSVDLTKYIRTIPYNRRVAVGLPRIDASSTNQGQLPAIPTSVRPLARDLGDASVTDTTPLLMLWRSHQNQPTSAFTLTVRPPSCDLETWDRWVAALADPKPDPDPTKTLSFRNTRVAAATALALFPPKNADVAGQIGPGGGPDLSLDDPAVSAFQVSITQLYTPLLPATVNSIPIGAFSPKPMLSKVDASTAAGLLQGARNPGVTFQINMGAPTDAPKLNPDGTILIPEGQVWQLTISPVVSAADNKKFEGVAQTIQSDFVLVIEAASAGVFATSNPTDFQDALWNSLAVSVAVSSDQKTRKLTANLAPGARKTPDWNLIHNIDVRKQAWRWMGRPLDALPAEWKTATSGDQLDAVPALNPLNSRMWEIGSFAERDDNDSALTQVSFNFVNTKSTGSAPLSSDDLSQDARAQFYRFGVVVHSRYEGLPGLQLSTIRAVSKAGADGSSTPWRRGIVPPLMPDPTAIPKPKVLMALPLMQTAASSSPPPTPGLLVITNEQWFERWGLAEELIATFDQARDPSVPLSVPAAPADTIPEIGPNPILTANSFTDAGIPRPSAATAAAPIGTTFDQATSAPLFANTTFLLDPAALDLPPTGVEHMQAKLRFNRRVNAGNFVLSTGAPATSDGPQTDSILVEFQPANQRVNTVRGSVVQSSLLSGLTFATSFDSAHSTTTMTFSDANGPLTLQPGPPPSKIVFDLSHLQLWAVVMKMIQDVTGSPQLACIDIFAQDASGNFTLQGPTATAIDDKNSVVYLLEVLTTKKVRDLAFTGGLRNAANLLFAVPQLGQQAQDAEVRVERVLGSIQNRRSD